MHVNTINNTIFSVKIFFIVAHKQQKGGKMNFLKKAGRLEKLVKLYSKNRSQMSKLNLISPISKRIPEKNKQDAIPGNDESDCDDGELPEIPSLDEIFDSWVNFKSLSIREQTLYSYVKQYRKHVSPFFGRMKPTEITTDDIVRFVNEKQNNGMASTSISNYMNVLKSILTYCHSKYGSSLPLFVKIHCERSEERVFSLEEYCRLLRFLTANLTKKRLLLLFLLTMGIRAGEACALRWENVEADRIIIAKTVSRRYDKEADTTHLALYDTKSRSSFRTIPIPTSLQPVVKSFKTICGGKGFVAPNRKGNFLNPKVLRSALIDACEQTGIIGAKPHTLRHSFATRCLELDIPIDVIATFLGHKLPGVTSTYIHTSFKRMQDNCEKLNSLIVDACASSKNV